MRKTYSSNIILLYLYDQKVLSLQYDDALEVIAIYNVTTIHNGDTFLSLGMNARLKRGESAANSLCNGG